MVVNDPIKRYANLNARESDYHWKIYGVINTGGAAV